MAFNLNKEEGMRMEKRFVFKTFIYFLCISFLLLTNGFHVMLAEAKEIDRSIGEMISRGEVKFESRENVWKNVESSNFPIFQGVKINTVKGDSVIALTNNSQIEVGQNTLFSFDRNDQMHLTQGTVNFRFPSSSELSFKVGNLTVIQSRSLQASKNPSAVSPNSEETIGSISVHPNGSMTVKSIRGSLSIVNQEHVLLAALSSKDTVTIPSVAAKSPSKVMVARAGETYSGSSSGEFLSLSTETWFWLGLGLAGVAAIVGGIAIYENNTDHHHRYLPVCP